MLYYIENYYSGELIEVTADLHRAINISKRIPDSMVTDEYNNIYYSNIELPF